MKEIIKESPYENITFYKNNNVLIKLWQIYLWLHLTVLREFGCSLYFYYMYLVS